MDIRSPSLPDKILNLLIEKTLFSLILSWEPPGVHCKRLNASYNYEVQWTYQNKTTVTRRTAETSIQIDQLSPNMPVAISISAICRCGTIGIPVFITARSKLIFTTRVHIKGNTV